MHAKAKYVIEAELRQDMGKGASRRLRRTADKIPAILYGGGEQPTGIMLDQKKIMHALENPGFYSHLLTLTLGKDKQQVVLKAIQRHHFKKAIMHMDFLRVKPTDILQMRIPIHFTGEAEAPGVLEGGVVNHRMIDIEVKCQANRLPESIEIDLSHMQMDQTIHLSDIKFPAGVESLALSHGPEHDHAVVSIHMPKVIVEEVEAPAPPPETEVLTAKPDAAATAQPAGGQKGGAAASNKAPEKGKDKGKAK